ncbi:MAG: cation transporter [Alkalinema sp. RU_4_3]|nr:cation transporter [Alkalinema sp. RU_4_3]
MNKPDLAPLCFCGVNHQVAGFSSERKMRVVSIAMLSLSLLFAAEWGMAQLSGSLSLQADAGHLMTDLSALLITLGASWIAGRHPGNQRLETLAALVNALGLLVIALVIGWEGVERWRSPQVVMGLPMLAGGLLGLGVNGMNLWLLGRNSQGDLNLRAAYLHTASDAASSLGILLASLSIHLWHLQWMDVTVSWLVAGLTGLSALPLIRESLRQLRQPAPAEIPLHSLLQPSLEAQIFGKRSDRLQ